MADVFQHTSYKSYLRECFPSRGEKRGSRRALALAMGCQPGFISQVLNDHLHLSLEQAFAAANFLKMDSESRDFFLLLLNEERAGNKALKSYYAQKRAEIVHQRQEVQSRIKKSQQTPKEIAHEYYSHWKYAAVHMAARNPKLGTLEKISAYLGLKVSAVLPALDLLRRAGFIEISGNRIRVTERRIHLGEYTGNLERHHSNWRLDAIRDIQKAPDQGLHFTSIMSLSAEAHLQIKDILLKALEQSEPIIEKAPDEQVSVLTIDLYELG